MTLAVDIETIQWRPRRAAPVSLVESVDFTIPDAGTLGLVGESGSGKSLLALTIMGLLPPGLFATGAVHLDGVDLMRLSERQVRAVRGARIGMIFQEPMSALNPCMRVGDQIAEGLLCHRPISRTAARAEALRLLDRVRIPKAAQRVEAYPHELSGGQRQRVGLAIALAPGPSLLIADEPTTALDVTVQAEVLALLREVIAERAMSLLIISHDLGVIASMSQQVVVLNAGRCMETGATAEVLRRPAHPYTQALIAALPRRLVERRIPVASASRAQSAGAGPPPLLDVRRLERAYRARDGHAVKAVDDVSFTIEPGTIHGIVGESGCGKSTLARLVMALDRPTAGQVFFEGEDLFAQPRSRLLLLRRGFQMVFQDPQGSLDPRQTVGRIVAEPLHLDPEAPQGRARDALVAATLESVGLRAADASRRTHEFSGGQRQRIAIARALIVKPKLVVADEPVSALDLSVQAQVLRLILDLRDNHGIAFLFISHSLAVVEMIADRVAVMVDGAFVETGSTRDVFDTPRHPYTRALVAADPRLDRMIAADPPRSPAQPTSRNQ